MNSNDQKIDIAVGISVNSRIWKNKKYTWSELVERLSEPNYTRETLKEFLAMNKGDQLKIKDVGGYVGGYLRNGRRKPENVLHRQLITLDLDYAPIDFWDTFTLMYDVAALIHGTHKHSKSNPRYRLIIPLDREATTDEYAAVSRAVAGALGIDLFDPTTFESNRLMFWQSTPKDQDYYVEFQGGDFLSVDEVLNTYVDWTDSSAWATSKEEEDGLKEQVDKQENPAEKRGIVGAFCRTYGIDNAIATYLSDVYEASDIKDRYTYKKGTTGGGLVVYDDLFAYSHHGTDPCSGTLNNAFDLVRIHLYGHLDTGNTSGKNTNSYKKMEDLATSDIKVKETIGKEATESARYDFDEAYENRKLSESDLDFLKELEVDGKGKYLSSASNINLILRHDKRLKGIFKYNVFDSRSYIFKSVPWREIKKPEPIRNVDLAGVRNYIESIYGITGNTKIDDALTLELERNYFNPVKDYLEALDWDGNPRVDTLLIDYFGTEDNLYTREAIRKMLVGAVARIYRPAVKFDLVLTLVGDQGTYKSTFVKKLGRDWFSDTFLTVHGKEALEQIQGAWIIEIAELSGLRKAEVESIKHFISKQEDTFRPAYGRTSETFLRQCVFFGTTNNKDFLRDPTGNRRFLPIDVDPDRALLNVMEDMTDAEVGQIWAEAVEMFRDGEPLHLSKEAEVRAKAEQKLHSENDERIGIIEEFLNKKLPENWESLDLFKRRMYFDEGAEGTEQREHICVAEIWAECLGNSIESMDKYKTRELNNILRGLDDWEQIQSTKNFSIYGKQRYFRRKK